MLPKKCNNHNNVNDGPFFLIDFDNNCVCCLPFPQISEPYDFLQHGPGPFGALCSSYFWYQVYKTFTRLLRMLYEHAGGVLSQKRSLSWNYGKIRCVPSPLYGSRSQRGLGFFGQISEHLGTVTYLPIYGLSWQFWLACKVHSCLFVFPK